MMRLLSCLGYVATGMDMIDEMDAIDREEMVW
jgi:hypothetical protein